MDTLLLLAVGIGAGIVARRILPWTSSDVLAASMAVGILGAFAGAMTGHLIGYREGDPALFVTSALGAMVLAVAFDALSDRGKVT
jgi:uncharacterized membrane protein YeaQ/YmgE (transglycosylase-associated protein family)